MIQPSHKSVLSLAAYALGDFTDSHTLQPSTANCQYSVNLGPLASHRGRGISIDTFLFTLCQ
jgi:hypothetical protein